MTCLYAFLGGAMIGFTLPYVYMGIDAWRHKRRRGIPWSL